MENGWTDPKEIIAIAGQYARATARYIYSEKNSEKPYEEANDKFHKYLNRILFERDYLGEKAVEATALIDEIVDSDSVIVGDWEERAKAFIKQIRDPKRVKKVE